MRKKTHREYVSELKKARPELTVVGKYVNSKDRIKYLGQCGHDWLASPNNIQQGTGCPVCAPNTKKTHKQFLAQMERVRPDLVVVGKYKGSGGKIQFQSRDCGHRWLAAPCNIIWNLTRCPLCFTGGGVVGGISNKTCEIDGRTFKVQGFEPQAILWLVKHKNIRVEDIKVRKIPIIPYILKNKARKYYPDFRIKKTLYEVKSTYTLGLRGPVFYTKDTEIWKTIKLKAKAALAQGYKYRLMVMSKEGKRIKLPKNWIDLSLKEVKRSVQIECRTKGERYSPQDIL